MSKYYGKYMRESISNWDIDRRFSTEDRYESPSMESSQFSDEQSERMKELISLLPDREEDIMMMYYFRDKNQEDIGKIFEVTQPAIHYRIKRARKRLDFLWNMVDWSPQKVYDMVTNISSHEMATIGQVMYTTSCQKDAGEPLGLSKEPARYRWMRLVDIVRKYFLMKMDQQDVIDDWQSFNEEEAYALVNRVENEDLEGVEYGILYRCFYDLRENPNILREIDHPGYDQDDGKIVR
jgi:predicted DNA-binding protein YlxM (UPF0122 family)